MSDRPEDNRPQEEKEPYTPASPVKRILAWVGIVYILGFVVSLVLGIPPLLANFGGGQ